MILVLSARRFVVEPAYQEWDRIQEERRGLWDKLTRWSGNVELRTVHGDRAYQSEKAGANPADGYPCRVSLVEQDSDC